jgi:hypothetical protein
MVPYGTRGNATSDAMATRMFCTERRRLLNIYSQAAAQLSMEVSDLAEKAGGYEADAFDRAWEHCEAARYLCSQIEQQLYDHLRQHRCAIEIKAINSA